MGWSRPSSRRTSTRCRRVSSTPTRSRRAPGLATGRQVRTSVMLLLSTMMRRRMMRSPVRLGSGEPQPRSADRACSDRALRLLRAEPLRIASRRGFACALEHPCFLCADHCGRPLVIHNKLGWVRLSLHFSATFLSFFRSTAPQLSRNFRKSLSPVGAGALRTGGPSESAPAPWSSWRARARRSAAPPAAHCPPPVRSSPAHDIDRTSAGAKREKKRECTCGAQAAMRAP